MHVLFGVDGSHHATEALERGLALFGAAVEQVTLAVALDYDGTLDDVPDSERQRAEGVLDAAATVAVERTGRQPETVLLVGRPGPALVRCAHERGCDLVVVGPRGKGASHLLFGSVATHLARGVGVPVAIMPRLEAD